MIPIDLLKGKDFTRSENGLTPIAWLKRPQPLYYAINDKASYGRDLEAYQEHKERCAATSFPLCGELPKKDFYVLGVDFELQQQVFPKLQNKWIPYRGDMRLWEYIANDNKRWVAVPLSPKEESKEAKTKEEVLRDKFNKYIKDRYLPHISFEEASGDNGYKWVYEAMEEYAKQSLLSPVREEREEKEHEAVTLLRRVMLKIISREYELPQSEQSDPFAFTDAQNYLSNP